mgnify:CR=1 FL=1
MVKKEHKPFFQHALYFVYLISYIFHNSSSQDFSASFAYFSAKFRQKIAKYGYKLAKIGLTHQARKSLAWWVKRTRLLRNYTRFFLNFLQWRHPEPKTLGPTVFYVRPLRYLQGPIFGSRTSGPNRPRVGDI